MANEYNHNINSQYNEVKGILVCCAKVLPSDGLWHSSLYIIVCQQSECELQIIVVVVVTSNNKKQKSLSTFGANVKKSLDGIVFNSFYLEICISKQVNTIPLLEVSVYLTILSKKQLFCVFIFQC